MAPAAFSRERHFADPDVVSRELLTEATMVGSTISHYKILEKLGEGGMGVVYKAQDTKLNRFVALKFLPDHVSSSADDTARFVQEAQAAAALNHPNICTIYGIDEDAGKHFIAMEFVDGQTLQEKKSNLSMKQALDIGVQISEGLGAAHEKGIVHRDIKPENIMIRKDGIAQIMDFGLAKLRGASRLTKEGSTVGTAGYMSPEQIQGQDTDHRSDIFSLGVLLFEMMTKQLPFKAAHETAMAYEIVNVDSPPMSSINPEISPELDAIVLECLEKDPRERTQSAGQVALDLKKYRRESSRQRASRITAARPIQQSRVSGHRAVTQAEPGATENVRKGFSSWIAVAATAIVMALVGYGTATVLGTRHPVVLPVIRATIDLPASVKYLDALGGHSAISPDGSVIVFAGRDSLNQVRLYVRPLNLQEPKALAGTDHAQYPFWSPDSRSVGFFADGKVKTIDATGGPVLELADAPFGRGGTWNQNGEILYSPTVADPNLYMVPASGGTPHVVTSFDSTTRSSPRFPSFLPDGRHFLFSLLNLQGSASHSDIYVGSVDSRDTRNILEGASNGEYADGHVFFLRQSILMAQAFNPETFALSGKPVAMEGNINSWAPRAKSDFSVTANGILLYVAGSAVRSTELVWVGGDGTETVVGKFDFYLQLALSPDGNKIAFDQLDTKNTIPNIFVYDQRTKVKNRLTFSQNGGSNPRWSRDGKWIFYNEEIGSTKANIYVKQADGSGEESLLARDTTNASVQYLPEAVSPDNRFLLISLRNESGSELATIDLNDPHRPAPVVKLGIEGRNASFSPDGKWIVYQSNELVSARIFVSGFKGNSGKWQLPSEAADNPLWGNGTIFYYSTARDRYESCTISCSSGTPVFGEPRPLFSGGRVPTLFLYATTNNGNKYLGIHPVSAGLDSKLSVIINWRQLVNSN
jgi:eukaryotic-like serine/threonine-protein kinase